MTASLSPVVFDPPLANPVSTGLFSGVTWTEEDGPLRWLGPGVDIRVWNYGGEPSYGVWQADPTALTADLESGDVKQPGDRPDWPDTFLHFTSWAADDCDLTAPSQAEVRKRAEQIHRLNEQTAVEDYFAERMLLDAGVPDSVADIVDAVSQLEGLLGVTGTLGVIHASAEMAAYAAQAQLIRYNGTKMITPLGHQWVFGGGYVTGLGANLVASSPVFGWRGPVTPRDAFKLDENRFYAIVERSLTLGYETVLGAVAIGGS